MSWTLSLTIKQTVVRKIQELAELYMPSALIGILSSISLWSYWQYYANGLGLSYNDARSHLDIGRRVVEGLKPGLAQLGSVWLPLPHILMIPTIWSDLMWHTGLSGALQSMVSFVLTGVCIYYFLALLRVGIIGRLVAVSIFVANINILYLQSTAMTELLLLSTMTMGVFWLTKWGTTFDILDLMIASFWIMLTTLIRYDGWFLFLFATGVVALITFIRKGYQVAEGTLVLFMTLAGVGIIGWFAWNKLIFGDALYFVFGPFSAHAQQEQLAEAGVLVTQHNLIFSTKVYLYALMYNSYATSAILAAIGVVLLLWDRRYAWYTRLCASALLAPLLFNIIALYLGHSVLFIQGLSGNTWFNARYGLLMMPSIAIFIGYLYERAGKVKPVILGILLLVTFFAFSNQDAVTIDDARVGSSQKNVSEVSGWLHEHAGNKKGFILISAASHDAIIFSSGLPMKRFIHEGTGSYWRSATTSPDRWARWIVMRSNDTNDLTFKTVSKTGQLYKYTKVASYPFADVYELKPEYMKILQTEPVIKNNK